ncbi:Gfo/Idh/MocA family oxidoreductase [Paraburkholderia sp. SIMBA_009]|uniref:Predicted dehydrogenase n=1 Tax=Paraburkholderia tropica TaxID=92647 RepID=A0AAQ1GN62_9BURK|nr:Gfo/Idh/MocA family oxidoreductase [Paraburkholderia tropica]RQN34347.1 gfo/Idh/MocA family oxidoreductase [Paraburkholderia tropica]SEK14239.1 Predicted dehydrogenase [Paraburkholderia tropica]
MSILSALGLGSEKKVRYAIVGLGDIAQEAMMPGVAHTGNSEITALVTGDPEKARKVGEQYGVAHTYTYEQFDQMLGSGQVDAIYVATPNWRHAEFVLPALKAGIHVLVEKPLEVTTQQSRMMMEAASASLAKLMVAYRLHFEPATLSVIERIRSGELGEMQVFTSIFTQRVDPDNHRAKNGIQAGPIFDMAPYPVNAARMVFEAEPEEVLSAVGVRHAGSGFGSFDDMVAVTLKFPGERLAQFVVSYSLNNLDTFFAAGTKGSIALRPAYIYGKPFQQAVTIGENEESHTFRNTDHFGGELKYFSDCILNDRDPEPDAEEGFADVRVIEGIVQALETGAPVRLDPFERARRIDPVAQLETLRAVKAPDLVDASNPGEGVDKSPKN